ncbi:MAG: phage protease [Bauldia sp.]
MSVGQPSPSPDHEAIALQAASGESEIALCAGQALPEGDAPEWLQLLPAGSLIATMDDRGPYKVSDAKALAAASLTAGDRLPIDENHATDLAAPNGGASPARGWIVALQARPEGIFGKVEWNAGGKALMAERAYRFISPVIAHKADNTITRILRASLVNRPNLRGMPALHQEQTMNPVLAALLKALELKDDADEATALQAVANLKTGASTIVIALQAALKPIAKAVGLKDDADDKAILAAVTTLAGTDAAESKKQVVALQAELTTVAGELKTLKDTTTKDKATAYVDGEITKGRVGVKPLRDHYIAQHMIDATRVEKEIGAMAILGPSRAHDVPPANRDKDGKIVVSLNAEHRSVAKALGIKPEEMAKTLAAEAEAQEQVAL